VNVFELWQEWYGHYGLNIVRGFRTIVLCHLVARIKKSWKYLVDNKDYVYSNQLAVLFPFLVVLELVVRAIIFAP
jgi:hypothetical protein